MISFHNQDLKFHLSDKLKIKSWINQVIEIEAERRLKSGNIAFIFCSDAYILDINTKFLNHKHYTDVITFNYNDEKFVSGDVFISLDTVKANSFFYKVEFEIELKRVIIHSILHLLGYNDSKKGEKVIMKNKEDFYLEYFNKNIL
jgi:rRNA maturation RNase YbeY